MKTGTPPLKDLMLGITVLAVPFLWFFDWAGWAWFVVGFFYVVAVVGWFGETLKAYKAQRDAGLLPDHEEAGDFVDDDDDLLADGKVVWKGSKTIRFAYGDFKGGKSDREVTVHQVVALGATVGQTYFRGHCHLRDEPRTFRADRIKGRKVIDTETGEIATFLKTFGLRK